MIGVINYGSGNFRSVVNVLNFLEINFSEINNHKNIKNCTHIILPGVGSYSDLMLRLKKINLLEELRYQILEKKTFFLGICVGMQVLSSFGSENEKTNGLNLIEGVVEKIPTNNFKLPNIGWHSITLKKKNSKLFANILDSEMFFYFVHSYYFKLKNNNECSSFIEYDGRISASVEKNNIYGVQFHPEKSQIGGCKLLRNFCKL